MKTFSKELDRIAIVGMGYVGFPLSLLFARNYQVIGFDVDHNRINKMREGESPISEEGIDTLLKDENIKKNITFTFNPDDLKLAKIKIITVGTPYDLNTDYIDYSQLNSALEILHGKLNTGDIVILKSTVPPGTTNGVVKKKIEKFGFTVPEDIGLCFSPERMVEGQAIKDFMTLPKIIGATDQETRNVCREIIGSLGGKIIEVSNIETAEMIKMVDNYSRYVFLGLTNEFALISEKLGVDVLELLRSAKDEYPRNSGLMIPGPGVGGSCLNKDPYILKAHMKKHELMLKMVESATVVNRGMPQHVAETVTKLAKHRKNITILGVAFKGDTDDTRFTSSYEIFDYLEKNNFKLTMSDPYVKETKVKIDADMFSASKNAEILIILTDHSEYKNINLNKLKSVMDENPMIFDTRGVIDRTEASKNGFEYHGLGRL